MSDSSSFFSFGGSAVLPTAAGVYAWLLGDYSRVSDADRHAAEMLQGAEPLAITSAVENREFITRAVALAAGMGITQFLDMGAGYPLAGYPAVHEIAAQAQVTYGDLDPAVVAAWEPELAGSGRAAVISADLRDPGRSLASAARAGRLDPDAAVCLILGVVLNYLPPDQARLLTAAWIRLLAPGSCVIISVGRVSSPQHMQRLAKTFRASPTYHPGRQEIRSWFGDLELVPPGMSEARAWRTGTAQEDLEPRSAEVWCGMGLKGPAGPDPGTVIPVPVPEMPEGPAADPGVLTGQLKGDWPLLVLRAMLPAPGLRPGELLQAVNAGLPAGGPELRKSTLFRVLGRLVDNGLAEHSASGAEFSQIAHYWLTESGQTLVRALSGVTIQHPARPRRRKGRSD